VVEVVVLGALVVVVAETTGQRLSITLPMSSSDATLSTQLLWTSFSMVVSSPVQPLVRPKAVENSVSTLSTHPPGAVSMATPFSAALA